MLLVTLPVESELIFRQLLDTLLSVEHVLIFLEPGSVTELELLIFLRPVTGDDCCGVTFPLPPLTDALAECLLIISRFLPKDSILFILGFMCADLHIGC